MTATVSFDKDTPQEKDTEVTATVSLTGTATVAGTHTINLHSATAGLSGTAQVITVTAWQSAFTVPNTYSFTVPAEAVEDLTLTHSFAATPDAATGEIQLGVNGVKKNDKVYFGQYTESGATYNVPWIVLSSKALSETSVASGAGVLPLISEYAVGRSKFRESSADTGYYNYSTVTNAESASVLKRTMDGLYSGSGTTLFTDLEQGTVEETTLAGNSMSSGMSNVSAHLFPLSFEEIKVLRAENLLRAPQITAPEGSAGLWGLRYSGSSSGYVMCANELGSGSTIITASLGVRPAFNLNLSSVLFSSAAVGGKSATGMGAALTAVSETTPSEWKLTLKDSDRYFTAATTAVSGNTLTLSYSGAETGTNEYISAIVKDSGGNVTHYGRLLQIDGTTNGASGTVDVTLPADMTGKTPYIFNEQYNGDKMTDYASALVKVSLTPTPDITNIGLDLINNAHMAETIYTAGAGTVTYTPGENGNPPTLTLNNATITPTTAVPLVLGSAKLVLIGNSHLKGTGVPALCGAGGVSSIAGSITVGGSGSILLEGNSNLGSFGVVSLTLEDTATVTSASGTAASVNVGSNAKLNAILKVNGTQTVYGNNTIAEGATLDYSNGDLVWTTGSGIEAGGVLILKQGTNFNAIKNKLTGSGIVRIVTATDNDGKAIAWDTYRIEAVPSIRFGTGGIGEGDKVYFGRYGTYDVPWIVLPGTTLSETSVAGGANALPLLSEYSLGNSHYSDEYIDYDNSDLKGAMNDIYNSFDLREQTAIANTTLAKGSMHDSVTEDLSGQKLFPLSLAEAKSLTDGSSILQAKYRDTGYGAEWRLRTRKGVLTAYYVTTSGFAGAYAQDSQQPLGVRPAMHFDLTSVLFTSAAVGGKSATGMDSGLTAVSATNTTEWKLTLSDTDRSGFSIRTTALSSASATFTYSGAQTGANEYISAVIVDNGSVAYYGRIISLPEASSASGTVTINLPSGVTLDSGTTLRVFNEQFNGDRSAADSTAMAYTDYASEPITVTPPATYTVTFDKQSGTGGDDSVTATHGSAMPTVTPPTRAGYTFMGYFDAATGGTKYYNADGTSAKAWDKTADTTLYAQWTYNGGGGSYDHDTVYSTIEGAGGTWTQGASRGYSFTFNAPFSRFRSVRVDGATVAASNYDKRESSTIITLHADYLETLSVGTHTLRAIFSDGYAQTTFTIAETVNPFTDVTESDWFYEDVMYARANGLMEGTGATTFDPHGTTTRGMIVAILYRLEKEPTITDNCPFDDVASGKYYEDAVIWAAANKIVEGYGNAKFGPEDPITREQMAAILYRYEQHKGGGFTGAWMFPLNFPDADKVSDYAYEAMCWCAMNGIINGNSDGTLAPQGSAQRCQVAAILHRFCDNQGK